MEEHFHKTLNFSVQMSNPNENILIHKGTFFLKGILNANQVWMDYTPYFVEPYKDVEN